MTPSIEAASLMGTLDKQLRLLRELSSDLVACRTAYVAMDLDAIYRHIATQTALCDQLRQLEDDRRIAWRATCVAAGLDGEAGDLRALISRLDPQIGAGMREIVTKLALADGELRHLNRAHTVLVEGSRRTLAILGNVLASFAPTYVRPANGVDAANPATNGAQP
jgi:hypothetical protein